jgi:di/tricarboxylate transporter
MSDIAVVFLVLGGLVVLFVWNRFPVEIVAMAGALTLAATGVLSVPDALSGFGDLTVIYIAALFIVSEGIDSTGVTTWAGQQLMARAGSDFKRLLVMMMLLVAILTAIISVNGAVAALIPMVVVIALRMGKSPSSLLMPLAFGAHAGSLLVLTGTPVHILVIDAVVDAGEDGFNYFEFGLIGVPVVILSVLFVAVFGSKLLPSREAKSVGSDLSDHARTLIEQYSLADWVARLRVLPDSPMVGSNSGEVDWGAYEGLSLVAVQGIRGRTHPVDEPIASGFVVTVRGPDAVVGRFVEDLGLELIPGKTGGALINRDIGVVELIIPPRSPLIGTEVFPGMVVSSGDVVVLAIQRNGEDLVGGPTALRSGDMVLVQGTWDDLTRGTEETSGLLVVDAPGDVKRQVVPLSTGAKQALLILAAMVVLLATGLVPAAVAAVLAAGALVLSGVMSMRHAYRSISWTTVVLVAAMIPLSQAVTESGAAKVIADGLIAVIGDLGPYALLAGIFLVTAVFGQLISNMATALIVIPIAVTAAVDLGVSVRPVLMCVTVAAAAAFITPVATPANLMVMQPGGYRFGDYWKLGLPLLLLFGAAAVFLVPVFWPF